MNAEVAARPGVIGRVRSRQSGLPSGLLGRIFGRAMVRDTADANDRALSVLALDRPNTVLEVGFGQGRTAAVLLDRGHEVLGVDASPTMVQQATLRNRAACRDGRATLRHGDGILIPFPDNSADVAFTVHTIYFMAEPAATLADVARVLRPGGTLVIACRTSDTPIPTWMDPDIYRIPTAAHLTAMLLDGGYDIVDHDTPNSSDPDLHLFAAHLPIRSVSS
jgi:ubiquinone/menaquinone biosynthesis C-methylase UbiE